MRFTRTKGTVLPVCKTEIRFAMAEAFLAEHIGGRHEPCGNDFEGSSAQILAGVEHTPGLEKVFAACAKEKSIRRQ